MCNIENSVIVNLWKAVIFCPSNTLRFSLDMSWYFEWAAQILVISGNVISDVQSVHFRGKTNA